MSSKLCIGFYYNEMEWLPEKVDYCKDNGLDLYVIDNMSTDGTWEWLIENKIPCHRFDTDGMFHLAMLQKEMLRTVAELNPDWVVYLDADLFIFTEKPLCEVIDDAAKDRKYNVIEFPRINFFQTKNSRFRYYKYINDVQVVFQHHTSVKYHCDALDRFNKQVYKPFGLMVNYGGTKEHRLEELKRREKAWNNGVHPKVGFHLRDNAQRNWIWDESELEDIKTSKWANLLKKNYAI